MPVFEKGCLWEEYPWQIIEKVTARYCESTVCDHCRRITPDDPEWEHWNATVLSSKAAEGPQWICPFVVVAENEGSHNSTGVCLMCILEAARGLGIELPAGRS